MLPGLQPVVRTAVMQILATLFETGLVDEVNLSDVLRLFGIPIPPDSSEFESSFSFSDPQWIAAYLEFSGYDVEDYDFAEVIVLDENEIETDSHVMPADTKLH